MGFFDKLKKITTNLFTTYTEADEAFFEELEETLILSDFGMEIAVETVEKLREKVRKEKLSSQEEVRAALREIIVDTLNVGTTEVNVSTSPCVFLFIGVNGVGKTTSIGKMANLLRYGGKKCLLCAADTFRAAAADQLEIWSQQNLMAELAKLSKIIDRECPGAARETLLVLDATTGQNGLVQAKTFKEAAGLTGIILTKLDGTAKGGIAVAIAKELNVPVKFAGVGEGIDDLRPFDSEEYAAGVFS